MPEFWLPRHKTLFSNPFPKCHSWSIVAGLRCPTSSIPARKQTWQIPGCIRSSYYRTSLTSQRWHARLTHEPWVALDLCTACRARITTRTLRLAIPRRLVTIAACGSLLVSRTNACLRWEYLFVSRARHIFVDGFNWQYPFAGRGKRFGLWTHTRSPHLMDYAYTDQELLSFPNGTAKPMWAVSRDDASWAVVIIGILRGCMGEIVWPKYRRGCTFTNHCLCHVCITRNHVVTGSHLAVASIGASPSKWWP